MCEGEDAQKSSKGDVLTGNASQIVLEGNTIAQPQEKGEEQLVFRRSEKTRRTPSPSNMTRVVDRAVLSDGEGDSSVFHGYNSSPELHSKKKRAQKDAEFSSPELVKTSPRLPGGKLKKANNADLRKENEALKERNKK